MNLPARRRLEVARWALHLTPAQVAELQRRLAAEPDALRAREILVTFIREGA